MSLASDITTDYLKFDDTETVTLTPKNRIATADDTVTALRQPLTKKQIDWAASVGKSGVVVSFVLFGNTTSLVPQDMDQITASSIIHVILMVEKLTLGTRYRCLCAPHDG